jgi:TonB family protein
MTDWKDDIERYRRGELTSAQMQALEKRALSDPFLADALEGADSIEANEFLADLKELQSKILQKEKATTWVWPLRIAASVVIVLGVFWAVNQYSKNDNAENVALEKSASKPEEIKSDPSKEIISDSIVSSGNNSIALNKSQEKQQLASSGKVKANEANRPTASVASPSAEPQKPIAIDPTNLEKVADAASPSTELIQPTIEADGKAAAELKADQVLAKESEIKKESAAPAISEQSRSRRLTNLPMIQGKVVSSEDGTPLPGVNVVIAGTTEGTVTDAEGKYQLQPPNVNSNLVFSFIGMKTKEVAVKKSTIDVALEQDVSQLSEVVVVGYGAARDENRTPIIKRAEPIGGLKAYNRYLDNDAHYPVAELEKKIKGRVSLKFTVRTDGSLDEFNIVKSLGKAFDEEALRMVKEGPEWSPTTEDNVAIETEVLVRVKFDPAKARK